MWSATPTPFNDDLSIDRLSVRRLVHRHQHLGISGMMLGGTCGEGPWMTTSDLVELLSEAKIIATSDLQIAVQASDNSARRVLERIEQLSAAGAAIAMISPPFFMMNVTRPRLLEFFQTVIRNSPIPTGVYDRGNASIYGLDDDMLEELLAEPNLTIVKDSSEFRPERAAMISRTRPHKPDLRVLCGDEFTCVPPIQHGYDGLFLGGAVFNAKIATALMASVREGDLDAAHALQLRMNDLNFRIYGGEKITSWLTGLKYLLVQMGIFSSVHGHLDYPLTPEDRDAIDEIVSGPDLAGYRADLAAPTAAASVV